MSNCSFCVGKKKLNTSTVLKLKTQSKRLQTDIRPWEYSAAHNATWETSILHADERSFTSSTDSYRNNLPAGFITVMDGCSLVSATFQKGWPYMMSPLHSKKKKSLMTGRRTLHELMEYPSPQTKLNKKRMLGVLHAPSSSSLKQSITAGGYSARTGSD